jgi:SMI1-KNR4 cell-wall
MTQEEIASIEANLDVVLPQPYKEAALAGRFADPIHDDAKSIIAINFAFRAGDYGDNGWRNNLVAIGHDGGGNYFCLDTDSFDSVVYVRDHETLNVSKEYDNFDAFVAEWA